MSERTEQLILMLTPEEKALIERLARAANQTPSETIVESLHALEQQYEHLDDDDADIEANIRQAMREIKEGKTTPITSIWDILDKPDDEDND